MLLCSTQNVEYPPTYKTQDKDCLENIDIKFFSWESTLFACVLNFRSLYGRVQDGNFIYEKYKEKFLIATSIHPNGHSALTIVEEESTDSYPDFKLGKK